MSGAIRNSHLPSLKDRLDGLLEYLQPLPIQAINLSRTVRDFRNIIAHTRGSFNPGELDDLVRCARSLELLVRLSLMKAVEFRYEQLEAALMQGRSRRTNL
ncbi:MAG: HEPN domain-containing protein [Nitrosospira sp.]